MRQVPLYLIIGNGRVARHFRHYFTLLKLPFIVWHHTDGVHALDEKIKVATHILILIRDEAIENFIEHHLLLSNATLIHFSGSLVSEKSIGVHPLFTFNSGLYTLETYQTIPFVIDDVTKTFNELMPGLSNLYHYLPREKKLKYHALCVLAGNFSCLLWQKLLKDFQVELKLPKNIVHPYLQQITQNLIKSPEEALTGPLVRRDTSVMQRHLTLLKNDAFYDVYKSFMTSYQKWKEENKK